MRHSGILAIVAASAVLLAVGCGGSGSSAPMATLTGVWTGSALQTRAIGDNLTLQIEYFQNGTALTGEFASSDPRGSSVSNLTGTINGNDVTATITNGTEGTTNLTGTVNSGSAVSGMISGNYTSTNASGTSGGTFTLTKSVGVTTPNIAGTWSGTGTKTGSTAKPLSLTFIQSQDTLTFTGMADNSFTGTGAIIGNHVTLISPGGTTTTYVNGTLSGTTISGTSVDSTGATGTFSISKGPLL